MTEVITKGIQGSVAGWETGSVFGIILFLALSLDQFYTLHVVEYVLICRFWKPNFVMRK